MLTKHSYFDRSVSNKVAIVLISLKKWLPTCFLATWILAKCNIAACILATCIIAACILATCMLLQGSLYQSAQSHIPDGLANFLQLLWTDQVHLIDQHQVCQSNLSAVQYQDHTDTHAHTHIQWYLHTHLMYIINSVSSRNAETEPTPSTAACSPHCLVDHPIRLLLRQLLHMTHMTYMDTIPFGAHQPLLAPYIPANSVWSL